MPDPIHANLADVTLMQALQALGDPVRLQIVTLLADQGEMACADIYTAIGISKTNASHHFKLLRGAGLVWRSHAGHKQTARLRAEEFTERFPALLQAVLANSRTV